MVRLIGSSASARAILHDIRERQFRLLASSRSCAHSLTLTKRYFQARLGCFNKRPRLSGVNRVKKRWSMQTVVINLPEREDRRESVTANFDQVKIHFELIPGVVHPIPLAGCAQAHVNAIRSWTLDTFDLLMVCEDDVDFLASNSALIDLISEFYENPALDVLALGNSTRGKSVRISANLSITNHTQTASCYVLKPSAASAVVELFEFGRRMLERGEPESIYAHDILWIELQRNSKIFAVPNRRVARQAPSYSDIQQQFVDYGI